VDSGTNGIYLACSIFNQVLARLSSLGLEDTVRAGYVPLNKLNFAAWPALISTYPDTGHLYEEMSGVRGVSH
jgi:hypothetical protein